MEKEEDKAPLFRSWNGWYLLLIAFLLLLILLFTLFTNKFQ